MARQRLEDDFLRKCPLCTYKCQQRRHDPARTVYEHLLTKKHSTVVGLQCPVCNMRFEAQKDFAEHWFVVECRSRHRVSFGSHSNVASPRRDTVAPLVVAVVHEARNDDSEAESEEDEVEGQNPEQTDEDAFRAAFVDGFMGDDTFSESDSESSSLDGEDFRNEQTGYADTDAPMQNNGDIAPDVFPMLPPAVAAETPLDDDYALLETVSCSAPSVHLASRQFRNPVFQELSRTRSVHFAKVALHIAKFGMTEQQYSAFFELLSDTDFAPHVAAGPKKRRVPKARKTLEKAFSKAVDTGLHLSHVGDPHVDASMCKLSQVIHTWLSCQVFREEITRVTDETADLIAPFFNSDVDNVSFARVLGSACTVQRRWQSERYFQSIAEYRHQWLPAVIAESLRFPRCTLRPHFIHLEFFFDGLPLFRRKTCDGYTASVTFVNQSHHFIPAALKSALHVPIALGKKPPGNKQYPLHDIFTSELVKMFRETPVCFALHHCDNLEGEAADLLSHDIDIFIPLYFGCSCDGVARNECTGLQSIALSLKPCTWCLFVNDNEQGVSRLQDPLASPDVSTVFQMRNPLTERATVHQAFSTGVAEAQNRVMAELGYSKFAPLWSLSAHAIQSCGIDTFHNEGENLAPRHFQQLDPVFLTLSPTFWNDFCLTMKRILPPPLRPPSFASWKGWNYACNGKTKMDTMAFAPLVLLRLLGPHHRFFTTKYYDGILAHSKIVRLLAQRALMLTDGDDLALLRDELFFLFQKFISSLDRPFATPTLHMCEHYVDELRYLGLWSLFTTLRFERVNKILRKLVQFTNCKNVCATILSVFHRKIIAEAEKYGNGSDRWQALKVELMQEFAHSAYGFVSINALPHLVLVEGVGQLADDVFLRCRVMHIQYDVVDRILDAVRIIVDTRVPAAVEVSYKLQWICSATVIDDQWLYAVH